MHTDTTTPDPQPLRVAEETFLVPNLVAAGPDANLLVSSMVIRGEQPVIVDTGAPIHRERWLEAVFGLVDPADVRWIFLSHDDGDHTGSLHQALDLCPNATLVANFFTTERLGLEAPLPLHRMVWLGPGDVLDAGDRRFRLVVPPIFDGPTTRALFDERTEVLWAVDSFASFTTGEGVLHADDVPAEMFDESFALLNSLVSPWHQWLDAAKYGAHVDRVRALRPSVVASAHGPVLTGARIGDAFDRVRRMAGAPIVPGPGQETLDELVAAALVEVGA